MLLNELLDALKLGPCSYDCPVLVLAHINIRLSEHFTGLLSGPDSACLGGIPAPSWSATVRSPLRYQSNVEAVGHRGSSGAGEEARLRLLES
jgi:hypothetical protein